MAPRRPAVLAAAERVRWALAWRRAGFAAAPWPSVSGTWPRVRYSFGCPPGWSRTELERAAERIALAAAAPWWELNPAPGGRWALLLDASDWSRMAPPPLCRCDETLAVPLGEHPDGPAVWNLRRAPHLLVAGATGSGKSSLLRNVLAALPLGWCWRVVVIDPKEVDFSPARYDVEVYGLAEAPDVLADVADDLGRRKERLQRDGCDHWLDLPERMVPVRPTLVVLDESADLLGGVGLAKPEAQRVRDAVGLLARQGRACGVHLVAAFTRPDTDAVPGAVRDQFAARVALGPLSPDGARMLFGAHRVPTLPDGPVGTGLSLGLDGGQRLRRLRVPWVTIDDVRRRHGLPHPP
jgi:hypothetical protein